MSHEEEPDARDHRRLGQDLDLFSFSPHSPGMPFWHPRGMVVWNALADLLREEYRRRGYDEVKAPVVLAADLWRQSGHMDLFRENMFFLEADGRELALKPMNCPGQCVIFGERPRSWRDLPFRWAESSPLHRRESSGALVGLKRVRAFAVDDAHIFCREDQVQAEVQGALEFLKHVYSVLGFERFLVELSLRPARSIGGDAVWARAESDLRAGIAAAGLAHRESPGEGAFYGPKIDCHVEDALGRRWQCGTVQLDWNLPERFALEFQGKDNRAHRPVMIHRAIFGSFERMIGVLLEHCDGALPAWLAPEQVRVLPLAPAFLDYGRVVRERLFAAGLRVSVDASSEKIGKRVRDAALARVPYVLVVGKSEAAAGAVSVRARGRREAAVEPLEAFLARVQDEVRRRSASLGP
jgi:threonyl-tRNA synthetase